MEKTQTMEHCYITILGHQFWVFHFLCKFGDWKDGIFWPFIKFSPEVIFHLEWKSYYALIPAKFYWKVEDLRIDFIFLELSFSSIWQNVCNRFCSSIKPNDNSFVFHWNVNSIPCHNFQKMAVLKSFVAMHKFDIICISETFLNNT